jgi:threonine dehydratase
MSRELCVLQSVIRGKKILLHSVKKSGANFIHPYNHPMVIAGQGTVAKEFLEDVPDLDVIIAPVGGGGLVSGICISAKHIKPTIKVVGCEPELADDAYRSLKAGSIQPVLRTDTIADLLRTSLVDVTFKILSEKLDELVTVSEDSIIKEMRNVWERMKLIIEPSCSVPVAVCMEQKIDIKGKKIGIILTGGNVDLDKLPWL